MFAKLTGTIDTLHGNTVVVDVHGVGYLVTCSGRTISQMGGLGAPVRLFIETQVREDAINLFGFAQADEQSWFKLLTTVQGVGARVALAILSVCDPSDLHMAIAAQDKAMLTRADGVGPKLGLRIVTELKDKIPDYMIPAPLTAAPSTVSKTVGKAGSGTSLPRDNTVDADAVSALVNLGYARAEAFSAVMKVRAAQDGVTHTVGDMIKQALNELARNAA